MKRDFDPQLVSNDIESDALSYWISIRDRNKINEKMGKPAIAPQSVVDELDCILTLIGEKAHKDAFIRYIAFITQHAANAYQQAAIDEYRQYAVYLGFSPTLVDGLKGFDVKG